MSVFDVTSTGLLFAAEDGGGGLELMLLHLASATVFAVLGIVVLALSYWVMEKITPFSITKEIEEDQNVALAIIAGAVIIGMSLIIAAAIHG